MTGHTRRELILRGAGAAGLAGVGTAAAASAGTAAAASAGGGTRGADADELRSLAVVEQVSAFAYAHLVQIPSLARATAASLRAFLAHEREHVRLLGAALARSGVTPPPAPASLDAASRQLAGLHVPGTLSSVRTEDDALHYLIGVETLAEGAYYSAMSRLSDASLLVLAAQVMSCEAQHWTALSGLLHAGDVYRAVPYPVVLG
jgi:hypothetical protein